MIPVTNNCLYCHLPITAENFSLDHVHYCSDCCQYCIECNVLKGIWCFDFDKNSETYKIWKAMGCYGFMTHEGHIKTCGQCLRTDEKETKKLDPELVQLMLKAIRK